MKGICLRLLAEELQYVDPALAASPVHAILHTDSKLDYCSRYIESRFDAFSFSKDYYKLPLKAFGNFSFDELCKLNYSSLIMMDQTVCELFERRPTYEVVRKIMSSMWRWGVGKGDWNEVVDVWNGIRHFSLELNSDFDIRLDYTTGYNQCSYSKYSRTYIDGVFAFLVYYRRKHVMTIGFSVTEGRRILIQQVQLKQPTGNRWLYKLPKNRIEFVIDLFVKYFPNFTLCVIDGESLAKKILSDYRRALVGARERVAKARQSKKTGCAYSEAHVVEKQKEVVALRARIAHIKNDVPRLAKFYNDCGRYVRGRPLEVNHLRHHQLIFHG